MGDDLDRPDGRPASTDRCLTVLDRHLELREESDRLELREAYLAIPQHKRHYALGEMDNKDRPLVHLCADIGGCFQGEDEVAIESMREWALRYFAGPDGGDGRSPAREVQPAS